MKKLTESEKKILDAHSGCRRCRKMYVDHMSDKCPMAATNTWPDPDAVVPITDAAAAAAKAKHLAAGGVIAAAVIAGITGDELDQELDAYFEAAEDAFPADEMTDSCVPSSALPSTTPPYLLMDARILAPTIAPAFPSSAVRAMLDTGSPPSVISGALAASLGLPQLMLPPDEPGLSSLSNHPLKCERYVKIAVSTGGGRWVSQYFRAKVVEGLPVPLILGLQFLSSHHIVISAHERSVVDMRFGLDLLRPRTWPAQLPCLPVCLFPTHVIPHVRPRFNGSKGLGYTTSFCRSPAP